MTRILISEKGREKRLEDTTLLVLKIEKGTRSQRMQAASVSWKKARKQILPLETPEEYNLNDVLILALRDPCWTSDIQKYAIVNLLF